MPRPKGSKNKVKTTKVTADFAAQIAAKQEEKAAVEAEILKVAASIEELNTDVKSLNADLKAKKASVKKLDKEDICKDELFLARKAAPALPEDLPIAQDLLETLIAHKDGCVGMAANMIGVAKRIIAFESEDGYLVMFNPIILKKSGPYETEEGCLSLTGTRKTKRWQTIKVQWQNEKFQPRIKTFSGWTAEIIQHELDHCDGIII